MHPHIDRILKRANALLLGAYHDPQAPEERKRAFEEAFARLNQGAALRRQRFPGGKLPPDPDGSETVSAARFVAQALGMQVVEHTYLDGEEIVSDKHLAIVRCADGSIDPQDAHRQARATQAGLCIRIMAGAPSIEAGFDQVVAKRRGKAGPADPRQPSFF